MGVVSRPDPPAALARALGRRIRQLRETKSWSQEKLAERSGLHRTYVGGLEVGIRNPSLASLSRLARALGVTVAALLDVD